MIINKLYFLIPLYITCLFLFYLVYVVSYSLITNNPSVIDYTTLYASLWCLLCNAITWYVIFRVKSEHNVVYTHTEYVPNFLNFDL